MIADVFYSVLQGYIDGVLNGEIVVGSAVKSAVARHANDLTKQSTDSFPYYFDFSAAKKVCNFFPFFIRHTIGEHEGVPFELSPWQVFCISVLYGWKRDADETRRFRKAFRSMARKNGKSTWAAAEAIYLAGFDVNPKTRTPEPAAQVILAATKRDQVEKIIFAEACRMRRFSADLEECCTVVRREFRFQRNSGEILTTAVDKPLDGLNPHAVILDELHEWAPHNRKFYDTMMTGSGARTQPMISFITTAGSEKSALWKEEHDYAMNVVNGVVKDERYFVFSAELDPEDDPFDPANWIKANPNLGVSVKLESLHEQAAEHKTTAVKINRWTRYHCNRIVTSIEAAFDLEKWDSCAGTFSDWSSADAIGCGVDLGARDDLAAIGWCARFVIDERDGKPVYRYEVKTDVFIAEDSKRDLTKTPFFQWIYDGLLQKSRYPTVDLRDKIIETCNESDCRMVAYDPYNGQVIAEELQQAGLEPFRMSQTHALFNEPIRDLMAAIDEKRLLHDGNELLRWAVNNCVLYRDRKDNWMFDKGHSAEKIDPAVAVTMAFRVASIIPARASGSLFIV